MDDVPSSRRYRRADASVVDGLPDWIHDDRVRALGGLGAVGISSPDGDVLHRNLREATEGQPLFRMKARAGDELWVRQQIRNGRFRLSCLRDGNRPLLQMAKRASHRRDPAPADALRQVRTDLTSMASTILTPAQREYAARLHADRQAIEYCSRYVQRKRRAALAQHLAEAVPIFQGPAAEPGVS